MRYASFERHYFEVYHGGLTFKLSKMAFIAFGDETFQMQMYILYNVSKKNI